MHDYISKYFSRHHDQYGTRKKKRCEDVHGNPIPWMTYAAIFQLEQFDFSDAEIFEWGGGYSTLYWSKRCKLVNTVEHDENWYKFVLEHASANTDCHQTDLRNYAKYINNLDKCFDVIVVDGYIQDGMRRRCVEQALPRLKPSGLLVLDNSDWLSNTCSFLRDHEFNQYDYVGFGPINDYPWCTSLFHKERLTFPRKLASPGFIPGGIQNIRD